MTTQRIYWYNVIVRSIHETATDVEVGDNLANDFTLDRPLDDRQVQAALEDVVRERKEALRELGVTDAKILISDYTDDVEGELVLEDDFDAAYADEDFDVTEEQVEAALAERDEDLTLCGRNPYRDHMWKVGRWIDEARTTFVDVAHFRTLAGILVWAEDDRNFEDRDAA